jgi:hypothetical protein
MRALLRVALAALVILFGLTIGATAASGAPLHLQLVQAHASGAAPGSAELRTTTSERGPPPGCNRANAHHTVDRWSLGASARPNDSKGVPAYGYDDSSQPVRHLHAVITTGQAWDPQIATHGKRSDTAAMAA